MDAKDVAEQLMYWIEDQMQTLVTSTAVAGAYEKGRSEAFKETADKLMELSRQAGIV